MQKQVEQVLTQNNLQPDGVFFDVSGQSGSVKARFRTPTTSSRPRTC